MYGLSESTVVSHANRPGKVKLGTVGTPLPCIQHKIAEDGEVLIAGPTVFRGYYKSDKATQEALIGGW